MDAIDEHATEILLDGRYRLGPCLGRGGMAAVYRAEDTLLGRTVAIKLLGEADEGTSADERVHSETTVLASLNHPSLVTLYDARLDPGHARYLAIEYVDGPTLASRLSDGPLSDSEAASLAGDLSEALQVVHESDIIHRDLKPSNVMLARDPRHGPGWTAKLMDFGIAYSLADPRVTSPGIVVGTAAYMAPEQVRGAELTPAVDIYSLGLVLIEALTGEPAFPVMGKVQTALRRLEETPTVPDSLGPRWVALLTRMTRVDPELRPSAREVAQAAAFLSDDPSPLGLRTVPPTIPSTLLPITTVAPVTGPTGGDRRAAHRPPTPRRSHGPGPQRTPHGPAPRQSQVARGSDHHDVRRRGGDDRLLRVLGVLPSGRITRADRFSNVGGRRFHIPRPRDRSAASAGSARYRFRHHGRARERGHRGRGGGRRESEQGSGEQLGRPEGSGRRQEGEVTRSVLNLSAPSSFCWPRASRVRRSCARWRPRAHPRCGPVWPRRSGPRPTAASRPPVT
ncbi:serine/threonine protein kinase [Microbacterium murale]|uniref:non-specific serine/threonine protein kinase n=1 Tax=Microbacterium murale TaxID=1081040 RepID=A0ABU0PB05_9MICO|nr:serine/threonine protein kinase [Microbacterium murale]